MISTADRQKAIELIDEAREAGARLKPACNVLEISARTYERWKSGDSVKSDGRPTAERPKPANSLSEEERQAVLDTVKLPEYASSPPSQIVPALADKGIYICSESTFYRILNAFDLLHHRGRGRAPGSSRKPTTYVATAPNQVWTWDITWLPGPVLGAYLRLYLIIDIFSRYIVGWEVWAEETAEHAEELVRRTIIRENLQGELLGRKAAGIPLVLHNDNGSPMKAETFLQLLISLGIERSNSRARVSNDNPYSEAGFRTLKYRPNYKEDGFATVDVARKWVEEFVHWYNEEHHHSAIGFVTPSSRHHGEAEAIQEQRRVVYQLAREQHPERWVKDIRKWDLPLEVALNPNKKTLTEAITVIR